MKRGGFDIKGLAEKIQKTEQKTASNKAAKPQSPSALYLSHPVSPEQSIAAFFIHVRETARKYLPKETAKFPITQPYCEVECRIGILQVPHALPPRRVTSSGPKQHQGRVVQAFDISRIEPRAAMGSGVSRLDFVQWTGAGLSEVSPVSHALGASSGVLKEQMTETEMIETVYFGYPNERRASFPGEHSASNHTGVGAMEYKERLALMDLCIPAAPYDLRISLASEKTVERNLQAPPSGWKGTRVKRRRSYQRRDKSMAWQIDVTEVTTTLKGSVHSQVEHEIEVEIRPNMLLQLINEEDTGKIQSLAQSFAKQLWWILGQINPLHDTLDTEEYLQDHPNSAAVQKALATCGALKHFLDKGPPYQSPIGDSPSMTENIQRFANVNFTGCMPVNFQRHHIEEIQRSPDNAYFLSEKTDGVRHFMIFTGDTVVLVDRAMRGKQPKPRESKEPFEHLLPLIQPGTVFDGEVVMNRKQQPPRPVFIVFDIMALNAKEPCLQFPFEERLKLLKRAAFRTPTAKHDMFDAALVSNPRIALPLVRKNFVTRTQVDELLSYVVEERGMRCYKNGDLHHHLTDGIIFQPNLPYTCGTDIQLLKWKYLDTVTIDVELLPLRHNDEDTVLRVGCMGEEQTTVDMTRQVHLPMSERMKLEADREESKGRIAEVGFNPETGDWYYLTMRADKIVPNHISTVLGTLMELGESLTTEELRYRMSVPAGTRDTYRKDVRGMLRQLLDHQRKALKKARESGR
jgi:mRNA capping enzyme, catalytic domain/mRNA capping enzyme, beta chain/mRNA capping enzyme, C-terminal domain